MFQIDPTAKRLRGYQRPGEVLFKRDGALAEISRDASTQAAKDATPARGLDGEDAMQMHRGLLAVYRNELERQHDNRLDQALDEDMFDHIQWTAEEIAVLADRGQAPLVFNLIQTTINWVLGSQRRSQPDYKILPRRKEGSEAAMRKDELLRHLRDENHTPDHIALNFADAVKVGVGWMETGEGNPADGPIVFDRHESWRNMLWDSRAPSRDLSDARFVTRTKWLDLDIAAALWPSRKGLLEMSSESMILGAGLSDYGDEPMDSIEDESRYGGGVTTGGAGLRQRIRVIEFWFRKPARVPVMQGGEFSRELFDPWSEGHWFELETGRATLVERPREVIHFAMMTEKGLLEVRQSPYRHNRFPFTPTWGYRRGRDGMPYGIIRGLRDIQRDLNKRASKALHHLSSTRVIMDEGAVDDIEETRNEISRPDAVVVKKPGKNIEVQTDHNLAAAHIDLMQMDAGMIQQVGGVTDENLGRTTNATSGKAIVARQDQGALATSMFFDNLTYAQRLHGEKKLVNIEQFYTERQQFRITDTRGKPQYVEINDGSFANAISLFKADFIIAEEPWSASTRQANAAKLLDLASQLAATAPQFIANTLDIIIETMDMPRGGELVKRIRQINGQPDPDEDPNNPSPETVAMQAEKAEAAAMQKRGMEAEIAEKEAKVDKLRADAARAASGLKTDNIGQVKAAIEAMIQLAGAPAVAAAVDQTLGQAAAEAMSMMPGGQPAPAEPIAEPQPIPADMPAEAMPAEPVDPAAQGVMPQ